MADRKAKEGAPKAAPATARAAKPRASAKPAKPVLPVKTEAAKAATPPAPVKALVEKAAPVSVAKAQPETRIEKPAPQAPKPVIEAALPPVPAAPVVALPTIEAAQESVEIIQDKVKEGIETMATTANKTVEAGKTAADQAQALFGDFNDRAKGVMEKNAKIVQEVTDLTKGNVEAIVASTRVAAKGFESLSREAAEYGRKSFEDASTALKSFAEVRSPADLFRLQSDFARSYFDSLVAETSKVSEQVLKIAGEVAEPITSRYSVAAERVRAIAI